MGSKVADAVDIDEGEWLLADQCDADTDDGAYSDGWLSRLIACCTTAEPSVLRLLSADDGRGGRELVPVRDCDGCWGGRPPLMRPALFFQNLSPASLAVLLSATPPPLLPLDTAFLHACVMTSSHSSASRSVDASKWNVRLSPSPPASTSKRRFCFSLAASLAVSTVRMVVSGIAPCMARLSRVLLYCSASLYSQQ